MSLGAADEVEDQNHKQNDHEDPDKAIACSSNREHDEFLSLDASFFRSTPRSQTSSLNNEWLGDETGK